MQMYEPLIKTDVNCISPEGRNARGAGRENREAARRAIADADFRRSSHEWLPLPLKFILILRDRKYRTRTLRDAM